jgi:threonine synthase
MEASVHELARSGLWQEMSGVASLAGLHKVTAAGETFDGPVVCICTSSGFKDRRVGQAEPEVLKPDWPSVIRALRLHGITGVAVKT